MYHKTPTYIRKGNTIRNVDDGKVETFKSRSAAKRRSRELQNQNGKLGDGFLRVER